VSLEHSPARDRKARKRWRRRALAEYYDVNVRTIDSWAKKGILPKPKYLPGSVIPFWDRLPKGKSVSKIA
jgi:hypothetical protein